MVLLRVVVEILEHDAPASDELWQSRGRHVGAHQTQTTQRNRYVLLQTSVATIAVQHWDQSIQDHTGVRLEKQNKEVRKTPKLENKLVLGNWF